MSATQRLATVVFAGPAIAAATVKTQSGKEPTAEALVSKDIGEQILIWDTRPIGSEPGSSASVLTTGNDRFGRLIADGY